MKTPVKFSAVAMFAVMAAACGRHVEQTGEAVPESTGGAAPAASYTPTPSPTPVAFPAGIYVASFSGDDSAVGSPTHPVRTIEAATKLASASGKDVYLFGGVDEGTWNEVVEIVSGVSIHGSVCVADEFLVDATTCLSTISGGSPTMVASKITGAPTLVENVAIVGSDAVQSAGDQTNMFYPVDGIGCVGRGAFPHSYSTCTPLPDAQGRPVPMSAIAVAVFQSTSLRFKGVTIKAGKAASGLPGADGLMGANGNQGGDGYSASNSSPTAAGRPSIPGTNPACPDANGGAGGRGGRWYWDGVTTTTQNFKQFPVKDYTKAYSGDAGDPAVNGGNDTNGGTNGQGGLTTIDQRAKAGANGGNGKDAPASMDGVTGSFAIDPSTLVASSGADGMDGRDGIGGGGAGGGGAASINLYAESSSSTGGSINLYVVKIGANAGSSSSAMQNVGETAGGSGGAGGAGGCGGQGGEGGQGGATSVALLAKDSTVSVTASTINGGQGGDGGEGGKGGQGGNGAAGGAGGLGAIQQASNVSGSFSANGSGSVWIANFALSGFSSTDYTQNHSESVAGSGGKGGNGGNGANGGKGGSGAGGSSYGVITMGASANVATSAVTFVPGTAGAGGTMGEVSLMKSL